MHDMHMAISKVENSAQVLSMSQLIITVQRLSFPILVNTLAYSYNCKLQEKSFMVMRFGDVKLNHTVKVKNMHRKKALP
jgi:hypothetical protein